MLVKGAVGATVGNLKDKDAFRKALMAAVFDSVRGRFAYGNNRVPIQSFFLREVVEESEGRWTTRIV